MHPFILPSALPALLAAMVLQNGVPQPIGPDLADRNTEIIGLGEDLHDRFTLPVTIDGAGPFHFMIDTGSQSTAITEGIHSQLRLPSRGTATLVGMASRREVEMVELDRLEVGSRTIHNLAAPVLQRANVGADGIIGLDSLQDMRVLFDFRNETIAIADADDKRSNRGFEIVVRARYKLGQLLITDALVEGVRATVIVDTGAQATMGNLALRNKIRARRSQDIRATDVNGVSMIGQMSFARSLKIEGFEMRDVPITYADTPAFAALGLTDTPVLSLGMQHLRVFDRIAIDFSKRRILFDLPRGAMRGKGARQNVYGSQL